MTIKEAYAHGFVKSSVDMGINPVELAKSAAYGKSGTSDLLEGIISAYNSLDPSVRHGLVGGLTSGLGTLAFSSGDFSSRLMKALAMGSLGGLGTYALSRSGAWDAGMDWLSDQTRKAKLRKRNAV